VLRKKGRDSLVHALPDITRSVFVTSHAVKRRFPEYYDHDSLVMRATEGALIY